MHPGSTLAHDRGGPVGAPAVLLLHAGIADRRMWDAQWPALIADHDAVRPDLRGFGDSTEPPSGPLDHVADVVALLDAVGIDRCHVVAASFGSGVAVELALAIPERVRSLVLAPPGGSLLATMTPDLRAFVDEEEAALATGDLDAAADVDVRTWVVGPGRRPEDVDPAVREAVHRMQRRAFEVQRSFGDPGEIERVSDPLDRLGEIRVPVLVLVGGHDLATTHDAADRVVGGLRDVERVDWPDVAHLPSMERSERFTALVLDRLSRL